MLSTSSCSRLLLVGQTRITSFYEPRYISNTLRKSR